MIHFDTAFGKVGISFQHNLPTVKVVTQNNRLASTKIKVFPGNTNCLLTIEQDGCTNEFAGSSTLHPEDQYNNEIGRRLSLERAIHEAKFAFQLRDQNVREIWSKYYAR